MRAEPPVVDCRAVSHRYGARLVLDAASLAVQAGSSVAVVGPDAVGKSTLLGLLAGVRRLQAGGIVVLGGDMRSSLHREIAAGRIGFMPQGLGRNLYPSLTVAENLDFIGRLFGLARDERRRRADRLLPLFGLAGFADRPAAHLSGGMKQKLSLCSALLHDPELLILDEPTTGIDPLSRRQFWSLIDALRSENPRIAIIVATAYMEEAERFDRVVVMDRGRILGDESPAALLQRTGGAHLEEAYVALQVQAGRRAAPPFRLPARVPQGGPPAIRAEGLTRRFGAFTAVDGVSFEIERGEIFGFLGSNGCGKTTTMRMLTGLLPASAGRAWLLGKPVEAGDIATRLRVGYMSQGFSLYEELSVRANLELHARLYGLQRGAADARVREALDRFDLEAVAGALPVRLPLGQRQRLQLAVACLHRPEVLILDEPTSGVDPAARDRFWSILGELSRGDGVTIFISTHFMNEAERCDRISLMHAGRVLAVGAPAELVRARDAASLDDAFVACLTEVDGALRPPASPPHEPPRSPAREKRLAASFGRLWAFARREAVELLRDRIRIAFAVLGPILLMLTFGYGITFDVENLAFAVLDRDQTGESRRLVDAFAGSRYFVERPPARSDRELDRRLRSGELRLTIDIPPGFGRDILTGQRPEIGFLLDGAKSFRAETTRGYVDGILLAYVGERARETSSGAPDVLAISIEPRFRYNQDFKTVFAIMPGIIMVVLAMIPAMLAAVGVVRERELGSISNVYASPARIGEYLIGKQLPYVGVSFACFVALLLIAVLHFGLQVKGSLVGLVLGGLLYVFATTAVGILVSSFVRTQVAALIATAVVCQVPTINFSGFLYPAATLDGVGRVVGHAFPALYFQNISLGVLAKARGLEELGADMLALLGFAVAFLLAARLMLAKQER